MAGGDIWAEELSRLGGGWSWGGVKADILVSGLTTLGRQSWGEQGGCQWLSWGAQEEAWWGQGCGSRMWTKVKPWAQLCLLTSAGASQWPHKPHLCLVAIVRPLPDPWITLWRGLWAGTCLSPALLSSRCPWEQAPSCLQELDALPFLILHRTLYKGRKQPGRPGASSGEDRLPRREGAVLGRKWSQRSGHLLARTLCPGPNAQPGRAVSWSQAGALPLGPLALALPLYLPRAEGPLWLPDCGAP